MVRKTLPGLVILQFLFVVNASSQALYGLIDGRGKLPLCTECEQVIHSRPKEILFGIHFIDGDVYFSMTSEKWFNKIFPRDADGITTDIVSKDQLTCDRPRIPQNKLPRGFLLKPVYRQELLKRMKKEEGGSVMFKLGPIPASLKGKEIEGNFVIVRNTSVCYYINFTNIPDTLWELLDMGLFSDSLINQEAISNKDSLVPQYFFYTKKINITVPFAKGKATFSAADIKPLYDSLQLSGYTVKKIGIRSFSSVEGPYYANVRLQQQRAQSLVKAIQGFQHKNIRTDITSAENWVEFIQDIAKTPHAPLSRLSKQEIKDKLKEDKKLADSLEPVLARHRKAVITIYVDAKTIADDIANKDILARFKEAINRREIGKAAAIQKSIFERIRDNSLPSNYFDNLEIPAGKDYSSLLLNRETYKLLLMEIYEDEAIENMQKLEQLDPANGKIKYNIYALQMRLWQYNDSVVDRNKFLQQIKALPGYGINETLVKRMLVNYYIILSEINMRKGDYDAKDSALAQIRRNYIDKKFSDRDLLSIGEYFCRYAQYGWADDLLTERIDKLDVDEDLLFFYLNLCIFTGKDFTFSSFRDMLLNAISIDNERFCQFFNSIDKGGISMQLLMKEFWKGQYCENCNMQGIKRYTLR